MALSLLKLGPSAKCMLQATLRVTPSATQLLSRRSMVSKKFREPSDKPAPWPYTQRKYNWFRAMFDDTASRFDENSRIIIVDGNIATGKHEVAKKLAEEFDLLHFPAANMDFFYIDDDGFDMRSVNPHLPPRVRFLDTDGFLADPHSILTPEYQYNMLSIRFEQYFDAMAHILHTGQGVVMERSVYSDVMFSETMHQMGYLNDADLSVYHLMRERIIHTPIFKPHVLIYLEAPPEVIVERIKKRGRPGEINSQVLTPEFIRKLDENYKQKYLLKDKATAEVLIYDVTNPIDTDIVVEDIERLPLDAIMEDHRDSRCKDWKQRWPRELDMIRLEITNEKYFYYTQCFRSLYRHNWPEDVITEDEYNACVDVLDEHVPKYPDEFNPEKTGYNYLFPKKHENILRPLRIHYRTR